MDRSRGDAHDNEKGDFYTSCITDTAYGAAFLIRTHEETCAWSAMRTCIALSKAAGGVYPAKAEEIARRLADGTVGFRKKVAPCSGLATCEAADAERGFLKTILSITDECKDLTRTLESLLFEDDENAAVLINPNDMPYSGTLKLPLEWKNAACNDCDINVQREADEYIAWLDIPAHKALTLRKDDEEPEAAISTEGERTNSLSNAEVRYSIDSAMNVMSCFNKETGTEFIPSGMSGNVLWCMPKSGSNDGGVEPVDKTVLSIEKITGSVRKGVMCVIKFGESMVVQTAWLGRSGSRLDFETIVDWRERGRRLSTSFPSATDEDKSGGVVIFIPNQRVAIDIGGVAAIALAESTEAENYRSESLTYSILPGNIRVEDHWDRQEPCLFAGKALRSGKI